MTIRMTLTAGASAVLLLACSTAQENPNYQYSTKYKAATPTNYANSAYSGQAQTLPASYQEASSYNSVNEACLRKEQNYELIGGGLGGTAGAIAGNKIIGGTTGTVVGAGLGGALGYGIGDKAVNCDPVQHSSIQPAAISQGSVHQTATISNNGYAAGHSQNFNQASYQNGIICPIGTTAQLNGTCLQDSEPVAQPVQSQAAYLQASAQPSESLAPTDSYYSGETLTGTPGYDAIQSQTYSYAAPVTPVTQSAAFGGSSQAVDYDYSENLTYAVAATQPIASESYILQGTTGSSHFVTEGDTVYSLSRELCVGVGELQGLNNLNASYGIKIGQTLKLPASQC